MKQVLLTVLVVTLLFSQSISRALALTLETIGVSNVGGSSISSWTYQGSNPTFTGTADASATVTVTINNSDATATADASGNWTYTPTTLTSTGTYPVTISSGTESISFTLDLTVQDTTSTTATSSSTTTTTTKGGTSTASGNLVMPDELPQTGAFEQTVLLLGGGFGLVLLGVMFYWKIVPRLLFDESEPDQSN